MLPALVFFHLFSISFASPFHKYPFAFVLDVGNEELQSVNTEQLRVSTPGGSIALRYPAIGEGDVITHVRVSGIDFGTDMKANIVEGGPGYKYVVLVFIGNPGVPYDAVLTVKTLPKENLSKDNQSNNFVNEDNDPNDSAEDLSDSEKDCNQENIDGAKAEPLQSSSNEYSYVHESNEDYSSSNEYISREDIPYPYSFSSDETVEVSDYENSDEDESNLSVIPKEEECDDDADSDDDDDGDDSENSDESPSAEDEIFDEEDDPNFNEEHESNKLDTDESEDYEDSDDENQNFNEIHSGKYKDSNNNNYIDADDSSAVAY